MDIQKQPGPDVALNLALSVIASSTTPLLILDGDLTVIAASSSFCRTFQIDEGSAAGQPVYTLGAGEWNQPRLRSLLMATVSAGVLVEAYEIDIRSQGQGLRRVVLNAHRLDYLDTVLVLLAAADVTAVRAAESLTRTLMHDNTTLLREMQHRIANSLQIIASLIMHSARTVISDEARGHLHMAHNRVLAIASVQQHLVASDSDYVNIRSYFTQLAQSLAASMIGDPDQLSIGVSADESSIEGEVSVSLGLIVTELVINALKHAFPAGRVGTIRIEYRSHGPDWTLAVHDDGVGFAQHGVQPRPGLGTSIIEALARQLDAGIKVADARPGTTISVVHVRASASDANGEILQFRRSV